MTTVRQITVRTATRSYETAFRNPHHGWRAKRAVIVFAELSDGARGVGEAWCDSGGVGSVRAIIEDDLAPQVVGQPALAERLWARMERLEVMSVKGAALFSAMAAIDIALHDAIARSLGLPLYQLLGGARDRVPTYASSGLYAEGYGPDALARDMGAAVERGFCGAKIKVAGAPVAQDVARVSAVREAIGPDRRLMVDALFANDIAGAVRLGRALAPFDLWFYEAPTNRRDVEAWASIRAATGLPLSGPEVEAELPAFRRMLQLGAVDYLQADATICGGITGARRIADLAPAFHRPLTLHCSGSAVSFAANAAIAAAFAAGESLEFHLLHQMFFDSLWAAGYAVQGGALQMSDAPGLGLELDPDSPEWDA